MAKWGRISPNRYSTFAPRLRHGPNLKLMPALTSWTLSEAFVLGGECNAADERTRIHADLQPLSRRVIPTTPPSPRRAKSAKRAR
jgi:hypothetical protein